MFQDKLTREIAAAAAQIKTEPPKNEVNTKSVEGAVVSVMTNEELKGNQHKIDANKNGKVDAHDFKLLRAKKKVEEETNKLDETMGAVLRKYVPGLAKHQLNKKMDAQNYQSGDSTKKTVDKDVNYSRYKKLSDKMKKEEVEQVDEAFPTVADAAKRIASKQSNFEKKKISTGTVYSRKYKAEPEENEEMPKKKAKTMKEMLNIYSNGGAEALVENLMIEEPSQDEYKKEIEVAHAKAEGKIRNDKGIAKPATQGVKMEEVEIELLDADDINGVQIDNIEERSLTDAEMNKREEIVKSMKKGIQGFKDRYGDKAKNVMYATATKQAMRD